jgi:hypothetical protein
MKLNIATNPVFWKREQGHKEPAADCLPFLLSLQADETPERFFMIQ